MSDPKQEWTERELCEAFDLTSRELQRLVMEEVISPPVRKYTRQFRYTQQHISQLRRHLRARQWGDYLQELLKSWQARPDDEMVQLQVYQLLSLQRLFGENRQQGLDELRQYKQLAPEIVTCILNELPALRPEDDLLWQIITLLYERAVPFRHKTTQPRSDNA
jgi:DNA-binding transcriptional MerR regulator